MTEQSELIDMTADIVAAFVSKNAVRPNELPELIATVHASLSGIAAPKPVEEPAPAPVPAVPVKKSITDDYLICLDDGKKFKSLRRHLSQLGMTPDEYRAKWGLPRDYPMVAPGYAAKRSELAKASGLGSSRRGGVAVDVVDEAPQAEVAEPEEAPAPEPVEEAVPAPAKKRGRAKKAA